MTRPELAELSHSLHVVYAELAGLQEKAKGHPWLDKALANLLSHTETIATGVDEILGPKKRDE